MKILRQNQNPVLDFKRLIFMETYFAKLCLLPSLILLLASNLHYKQFAVGSATNELIKLYLWRSAICYLLITRPGVVYTLVIERSIWCKGG